ncbi:circadian clock KaiB family protein [Gloeothece verrucosa]|uniref:KaiB domain protein n=1 Tax=Gloeothece verrucosa (strain PCC 7822) TaxID=497965 RepID=E0UF45_GLOV7|nr:circadian clock KaiB family protein [Gloeothece verrucosa]ADN14297.1 KaiB domain protein [Gloeothece verrucosa PCC 7822]
MNRTSIILPQLFKGIALFTPGGDLIYCIDPSKQGQWHLNLCTALQEILALPEPPHFLIPGYTATVDRWFDTSSQDYKTVAEVYPAVQRYQPLLNAIFATGNLVWQTASWQEQCCNPAIVETYRDQFPQLWENHDLIVGFEKKELLDQVISDLYRQESVSSPVEEDQSSYVLRLFVSGNSVATKQTLKTIHQLLEEGLRHPYTLKVIDISKYPEQAENNQVSAIPTLMRVWPQPVRRIVGELGDLQRVLQILATR